jgi:hypothetical protein
MKMPYRRDRVEEVEQHNKDFKKPVPGIFISGIAVILYHLEGEKDDGVEEVEDGYGAEELEQDQQAGEKVWILWDSR